MGTASLKLTQDPERPGLILFQPPGGAAQLQQVIPPQEKRSRAKKKLGVSGSVSTARGRGGASSPRAPGLYPPVSISKAPMTLSCDLCRADAAEPIYRTREKSFTVFVCACCGLLQSINLDTGLFAEPSPVLAFPPEKDARPPASLALIRDHADLSQRLNVLDAGAGRGAFVRAFLGAAPKAELTAVEPDQGKAWACAFKERSTVVTARLEDTKFADASFDIVHSRYTLEYLASPMAVLADHWRVLKPGGLLVIETRNLRAIREDDILEEWFTPKRRFHFSAVTLANMLTATGFILADGPEESDAGTLLVAAVKRRAPKRMALPDPLEARSARALVSGYKAVRERNLAALAAVSAELTRLAPRGVALWGAGRLLDMLVRHGGLDPQIFSALIDRSPVAKTKLPYGELLSGPEILNEARPGVIVVMSDAQAGEIQRIAAECAPGAEIIHYSDLIFRALDRAA